jgi:hypothetical protein
MSDPGTPIRSSIFSRPAPSWLIVTLLVLIAAGLWLQPSSATLPRALAQGQPLAGARGVYAFTGQLDGGRTGLFMLDVDQGTIWAYALQDVNGTAKLRLIAARTWIYDRYLQDFNNAAPDFRMVQRLVAEQRAAVERQQKARESSDEPNR